MLCGGVAGGFCKVSGGGISLNPPCVEVVGVGVEVVGV